MSGLVDRARRVLPGGNTRSTVFVPPHPPYAVRGAGAVVTDDAGHETIDCNNNYTSLLHGHADPDVLAAAVGAAGNGSAFGIPTASEVELAELLRARTGIEQWRFCNSGTEAVMMAVRAARAHTGRDLLVRFDGSYHGTADAVVPADAPGVPRTVRDSVLVLPQGDADALGDAFRRRGGEVAAVLIDLMPNRAGLRRADPAFVDELRTLTRRHGALLVVDEIITFRLAVAGLHAEYGLEPDLVTTGKIIGGGFPAGAVGGGAAVLAPFQPLGAAAVSWGGTFSANPVTMAAGVAALGKYGADAVSRLNAAGEQLRSRLRAAGVVAHGSGSLIRLVAADAPALWWALYRRGVLVGTNGLVALSTAMSEQQCETVADTVLDVHRELPALLQQEA